MGCRRPQPRVAPDRRISPVVEADPDPPGCRRLDPGRQLLSGLDRTDADAGTDENEVSRLLLGDCVGMPGAFGVNGSRGPSGETARISS